MRNEIQSIYHNKLLKEIYYPLLREDESEINVLTRDEPIRSKRELKLLYQEAQEYDFRAGKTSKSSK